MARPKVTRGNLKDHKVTVRLDHATYEMLKEAMERGTITNLSEALRSMIRQRVWEEKTSELLSQDSRLQEMSDRELRTLVNTVFRDFGKGQKRGIIGSDEFLKGFFSALGGLVREALMEWERRKAEKKTTKGKGRARKPL